jgi:hypothetical protein
MTMARRGRKPLALEHIQQLEGSAHAKQRMAMLLSTLQSSCTVGEACRDLELSESHFHALRHRWLQNALALLEPRAPGRPPRDRGAAVARIEQLEQEVQDLRGQLVLAQARCEVTQVMAHPAADSLKKGGIIS